MRLALSFIALALTSTAAFAQAPASAYSKASGPGCKTKYDREGAEILSATTTCKGHGGMAVVIQDIDARIMVSYGARALMEPAASATFGPLNSIGDTIEWRIAQIKGKSAPFATILRWRLAPPDEKGDPKPFDVLVVTRLGTGNVCHVAYVDAQANRDANELARKAADEAARKFRCGADKAQLLGKPGRLADFVPN